MNPFNFSASTGDAGRLGRPDHAPSAGLVGGRARRGLLESWRIFLWFASAFLVTGLYAQTGNGGGKPDDTRANDRSAEDHERKQAFTEAMALYRSKDHSRAEERLLRGNRHQSRTLGWYLESAGKLTQVALSLRQQYDLHGAVLAAQRAQALLEEAGKAAGLADKLRERAAVYEMKGYLEDELLRDPDAARASYEKAKKIDPQSVRAGKAIEHLDADQAKDARLRGKS
ncbi:MAG TPA: hypothetical protein VIM71_00330 [Lacunisphaera sp.]